jgi:hypothetical protein
MKWCILSDEEAAEYRSHSWQFWHDLEGEAYRLLFVHLCEQADGHDWYLDIAPNDDGITLGCRKCPAWVDDVYPDGIDMLTGEFEVYPGYVLRLRTGSVQVNGRESYGAFAYGWRGPVTVELHVEKYTGMDWIGEEYDAWIEVDPRADPAA